MTPTEKTAVDAYLKKVSKLLKTGVSTEHTFRPALSDLLSALMPKLTPVNEAKRCECGAPDFILIDSKKLPIMYVETKDIDDADLDGKKKTGNKEQFDRYKAAFDSIVFTDFLDFHFFRHNGVSVGTVRIADWDGLTLTPNAKNFETFVEMMQDAATVAPQKIETAKRLAKLMAGKARMLQDTAFKYLGPLVNAYDAAPLGAKPKPPALLDLLIGFRSVLMPDVGAEEFSDIFAQTLTYGMFAARLKDKTPATFTRFEAMSLIPNSNPFLKNLFMYVGSSLEDEVEWIVDDLAELFRVADLEKIMKDYGKTSGKSDPMVHFYENFLDEYDAGLRKNRGVWYTPIQVVGFIVRAVDWILQNRFGFADGLADDSKTQIEVEEIAHGSKKTSRKVKKTVHRVQVLDPATGTGTFLAEIVRQVHNKFVGNEGKWSGYVEQSLLPRLNGFELLMASYTMAHVKLDFALNETGVTPTGKERFRIFLTDSLIESHDVLPGGLFASALGDEQQGADEVKRDMPVMVVLGNPPYLGESQNKGKWIMRLMKDYKYEPGTKMKLQERNPKWLNNDYAKFIRLGEHYVDKNGNGIVAYITPHGFLRDPTFRGMRWHLMQTFDEIWTFNLHGSSKPKEVAPSGGKDECVFKIQPGVTISLFVKYDDHKREPCKVHYADLWGTKLHKLETLETANMGSVMWKDLNPVAPRFYFVPKSSVGEAEWNAGFSVKDLFLVNNMGVTTGDDSHFVAIDQRMLPNLIISKGITPDACKFKPYTYRPFDLRVVYYDSHHLARPREKFMSKVTEKGLSLTLIKNNSADNGIPVFVAEGLIDKTLLSSKDNANIFPLWLYEETLGKVDKCANMDKAIVAKICTAIGEEASPEDIFAYVYGVLHTPQYREKFKEFLKDDFPRIPYPKNTEEFKAIADIGNSLIETHLMHDPKPSLKEICGRFPVSGDDEVAKITWEPIDKKIGRVWINDTQYFDNVPLGAWNMPIGGYMPAEKWLKDRKGRKLDNADKDHYQRIILALDKTASLMGDLEKMNLY